MSAPAPTPPHNLLRVSPRIWSGAEPATPSDFAALEQLGIKTIISVDGARPGIEEAHAHGMRYVHAPFGYDGVPLEAEARIAKAVRETDEPIYIHCHHGQHRGPAGAAIALWVETGADAEARLDVLRNARTGEEYSGLWRDVEAFDPAAIAGLDPELHEVEPIGDFAAQMASIDRTWDRLALARDAGWGVPPEHPDVDPPHEAKMLEEDFRELARLESDHDSEEFRSLLHTAGDHAAHLRAALKDANPAAAETSYATLKNDCRSCHGKYRN